MQIVCYWACALVCRQDTKQNVALSFFDYSLISNYSKGISTILRYLGKYSIHRKVRGVGLSVNWIKQLSKIAVVFDFVLNQNNLTNFIHTIVSQPNIFVSRYS